MEKLLLILSLVFVSSGYIREGPLYELFSSNYDQFLQEFKGNLRVILFYGQHFGQGRSPSSEYFSLGKSFPDKSTRFAKVNTNNSTSSELMKKFSKRSPPLVVYCLANTEKCIEYKLELTAKSMSNFFIDIVEGVVVLNTTQELDLVMNDKLRFDRICVGVFEEWSGTGYQEFINYTYSNANRFRFALAKDNGEWSHLFKLNKDAIVVVSGDGIRNQWASRYVALESFKGYEEIDKFMDWASHPFLTYVTLKNFQAIDSSNVPLAVIYLDVESYAGAVEGIVNGFVEVFKEKMVGLSEPKKMQLAIANIYEFRNDLASLALNQNDMVFVLYFKGKIYTLGKSCFFDSGVFISSCFTEFLESFEKSTLTPYYKSDPLPVYNYENGIKVLVTSSLISLLESHETYHFIFTYNSKQNYQKFLDVYESVSQSYLHNYHVDFSKINTLSNSLPSSFSSKPESGLYLSTKNSLIHYSGRFEADKISSFLEDHLRKKIRSG